MVESQAAFDPQAQLDGLTSKPLVRSHVGMATLAHNLEAALQYMFDVAHKFGAPIVPHAHGPVLIVKPFSWPQAQHLGASMALTHGSLSHICAA